MSFTISKYANGSITNKEQFAELQEILTRHGSLYVPPKGFDELYDYAMEQVNGRSRRGLTVHIEFEKCADSFYRISKTGLWWDLRPGPYENILKLLQDYKIIDRDENFFKKSKSLEKRRGNLEEEHNVSIAEAVSEGMEYSGELITVGQIKLFDGSTLSLNKLTENIFFDDESYKRTSQEMIIKTTSPHTDDEIVSYTLNENDIHPLEVVIDNL